jgi:uncharacterized phage protein (TIGR02218 family)
MKEHLKGTSSLAIFIKLTAKDGDVIAVTNAAKNKKIDGVEYKSLPIQPTQLQSTQGLKADNTELITVLGGLYTAATLRARKWFGARVEYQVYNYKDFSMGAAIKKVGFVGETELGKFTAKPELLSLTNKLSQSVGFNYLETCNVARLGDARCKVDLNGSTVDGYKIRCAAQITAVTNNQQFAISFTQTLKSGVTIAPNDLYADGEIEFTSGNNDGLETLVLGNSGNGVTLWLPPFYGLAVGDSCIVTVGCNRKIEQCVQRFNNGVNNRSFWTLPGRDKLFTFPE